MANVAEGTLLIQGASKALLKDLKARILKGPFNYETTAQVLMDNDAMEVHFQGRWTCLSAWDYLDELLADKKYPHRAAFIGASLRGTGQEPGCDYSETVTKRPGEKKLTRVDGTEASGNAEDWQQMDFWQALGQLMPKLAKTKSRKKLPNGTVVTIVSRSATRTKLSIAFGCQTVQCTLSVNKKGVVKGLKYSDDGGCDSPEDSPYCEEMIVDLTG